MTLRVLIVDDEPPARASLRVLLARDPQVQLVGECGSGAEAIEAIRSLAPQVLFLDVQMPEVDGFDVIEQLGAAAPPAIVFVTAYDQHALRAFDAGALDYLVKPYTDERFALALARAKEQASRGGASALAQRLVVKSGRQLHVVPLADIDWIESADYCVDLHVGPRTHSLRRSMAAVESELEPAGFCRIHRTAIVNLARVRALGTAEDGELEVLLLDGARLPMSRRYRAVVEARLGAKAG
jgi:two-component system LytT family response regulator